LTRRRVSLVGWRDSRVPRGASLLGCGTANNPLAERTS
jgi:hypothetical protein